MESGRVPRTFKQALSWLSQKKNGTILGFKSFFQFLRKKLYQTILFLSWIGDIEFEALFCQKFHPLELWGNLRCMR